MQFVQDDFNRLIKSMATTCSIEEAGRANFNPMPAEFRRQADPDDPEVLAIFKDLFKDIELATDQICAFENLWGLSFTHPDQKRNPHNTDPLEDERRARRWQVLAMSDYLADKGFLIGALLARHFAGLVIPMKRNAGQEQLTIDEIIGTVRVANMRIHVEREMRRGREFHRLDRAIPITDTDRCSDEVWLAFMLGNFQAPLTGLDFGAPVIADLD